MLVYALNYNDNVVRQQHLGLKLKKSCTMSTRPKELNSGRYTEYPEII